MKKILVALVVWCNIVSQSFALITDAKVNLLKDSLKKDSISFNTAYLNGQYTNKQLTNFNVELLNATDRILQNVQRTQGTAVIAISCIALLYCNEKASIALHEVGHGLRAKSYGLDYELLSVSDMSSFNSLLKSPFEKNENFLKHFLKTLFEFNAEGGACRPSDKQVTDLDHDSHCNAVIVFFAGGMNNQIQFAEKISDNIYSKNKNPGLLSYVVYLENRLNPIIYDYIARKPEHDPFSIRKSFEERGENNFKKGAISKAGWISLFLSATTYSIFTNKSLQFHGFRIPDVFPYTTTRGMSYKVVSGYEIRNDLNLIFGFESALKIEPATEYSLGISHLTIIYDKLPVSYSGIVTFGQGLDFEASCSVPLSKYFSVGTGCEIYSVKSLQGQRNATTNMKKDNGSSCNFFAFVSYRY